MSRRRGQTRQAQGAVGVSTRGRGTGAVSLGVRHRSRDPAEPRAGRRAGKRAVAFMVRAQGQSVGQAASQRGIGRSLDPEA